MWTNWQTTIERANAVFINRSRLGGNRRLHVDFLLVRFQQRLFEKRHHFIKHRSIAGNAYVERCDKWKPQEIVRKARAHAAARRRVPPMLHIALFELMTAGNQYLLTRDRRTAVDEGHDVLQLVAKTKSAA